MSRDIGCNQKELMFIVKWEREKKTMNIIYVAIEMSFIDLRSLCVLISSLLVC